MNKPTGGDDFVSDDDYDNDIPLQHRRPFGSGLHKKAIAFVPATEKTEAVTETVSRPHPQKSIADIYLDMVLDKEKKPTENPPQTPPEVCKICNLPVEFGEASRRQHETSLTHMIALPHSHPPSALDRSRMGLSYLETHGWDPDSRKGLGASNQGISFPVKAKPKDDKLGIGIKVPKNLPPAKKEKDKPKLLNAKQVRKMAQDDKRKAERIRAELNGAKDLSKYLGSGLVG